MNRTVFVVFFTFFLPLQVFAANAPASFSVAQSLLTASSSPGNAYVGGASVVVTAPVSGDLIAVGGSVVAAAPVSGDALLFAGSISSRAPIVGDFRAIGGSVSIEKPVQGDLIAFGLSVVDSGRADGSVLIAALNTTVVDGAAGPTTIYGNNVSLAGDFAGDVTVVASGHLGIAEHTTIHGTLSYQAPEKATVPASAAINTIEYKNVSFLPDAGTSRTLAFVSVGFFLLVRILGALILAGLLAGLFPKLTQLVVAHLYGARVRSILLSILLGFAVLVATPILFIILTLTFVGIGIAVFLCIAYALLVVLSLMYAGILLGGMYARRYVHREAVLWHDGVLGMLALSLISFIPFFGVPIALLLMFFAAGALLIIFFNFAFSSNDNTF